MEKMFDIKEELRKLPNSPGVYVMHDSKDEVIYVGKAINLKNRVRQYFQSSNNKSIKIQRLVTKINYFEYIVTDTELEALVLECNLIKEHRPKYNTIFMDDKGYPFVKVTVNEPFPRVMIAHKMIRDKSKYFGPYTRSGAVKDTIDLIEKLYKIRTCNRNLPKDIGKGRPCLNYQINQCLAPCQGYVSMEKYRESIQEVIKFLNGNYDTVIKDVEAKMLKASEELKFEKAIEYRELLEGISKIDQKQKITDTKGEDRDILALATEENDAVVQVFFIRNGKLIGREHFYLRVSTGDTDSDILESFIKQYYGGTPFIPGELIIQKEVEDIFILEEWLSSKRGTKVKIKIPKKGTKEKLVEMAASNAKMVLAKDKERLKREEARTIGAVREIEKLLGVGKINRMEAFDISNTSGYESVGSMVVYEKGKPKKNDYRKFKIKGVQGIDDYKSLREVLSRRFAHGLKELEDSKETGGFNVFPDLILMDGGKGQVNIAIEVLAEFKISIPVCGMVKDEYHRTRGLYYNNMEIEIDRHSEGFRLITRIQDEAHRFAITYHRQLRSKGQVRSILENIKGVGSTRRKALMGYFDSIEEIGKASMEKLMEVPGMNEKVAKAIYDFFRQK